MSGHRVHGPQNFLLELDGNPAGRLFGMTGGRVNADVVVEKGTPGHKHIAGVKYEDITVSCGIGMARAFYDWIGSSFSGSSMRKSGAVVNVGQGYNSAQTIEFHDALITSVELPACDAGSKDPALITVSISPEWTRFATRDTHPGVYTSAAPKGWYINDFKLIIDGLESECSHVMGIGALRLGQSVTTNELGDVRRGIKEPTKREFSDLIVTLPSNAATGFQNWFEEFVVKGQSGEEKNGLVQFFAPHSTKAYLEVTLIGLGLYKIAPFKTLDDKAGLPSDFTMYCNKMEFKAGPAAVM